MEYLLACCTDKGKRKAVNQDSLLVRRMEYRGEEIVLAVICDGMGGLKRGEVASARVIHLFGGWFDKDFPKLAEMEEFEDELYDSWEELLQNVHREITEYGHIHGIRIGTTVTAMLLWQKDYYIAHVGDCRIYEIKEGVSQLTKDQIQTKLTAETGEHVLLQGIGASKNVRPAYYSGTVKEDAVYLLCTDGFRHKVNEQELYRAFDPEKLTDEEIMAEQGREVTRLVIDRGEKDNISVILVRTVYSQESHSEAIEERRDGCIV